MKHSTTGTFFRLAAITLCLTVAAPITTVGNSPASASTSRIALCRGNNLWGAYVATGAATGNFIYTIALINVSHTTCRLTGYPKVQGEKGDRTYDLPVRKHGTFAGNLVSTVLSPRMSGELLLSVADNCNALNTGSTSTINKVAATNTYSNLTIKLPGAAGDVYVTGFKVDIACGLEVSRLGWSGS